MSNATIKDSQARMDKAVQVTREELSKLRTGRANPNLLDSVRVNYYGAQTPLKQLATVSAPEPRLLIIQPFDGSVAAEIHKTIQTADLGLQPQLEGKTIRVPIPALSKERREDLVKVVHKVTEDGRVAIRSIRRDANDQVKNLEKEKKITEDERTKSLDEVQKLTDKKIKEIDDLAKAKEEDLRSV